MSKTIKLVSLSAAAVLGLGLLGGCATPGTGDYTLEDVMKEAQEAKACCQDNKEAVNRAFRKGALK